MMSADGIMPIEEKRYPPGYQWIATQSPGVAIGVRRMDDRAVIVFEYYRDGRRRLLPFILGSEERRELAAALAGAEGGRTRGRALLACR